MRAAGIKMIGPGDITQDTKLQAMGDAAIGPSPCTITMSTSTPREQDLRR
jgi:hypothetical protein